MTLVASGLTVGYQAGHPVVGDVELTLEPGAVTVLVGANGCGKSTLLRTMAALQAPLAGQVSVDGDPVDGLSRRELSRRLAFLPQQPLVPAGVTVGELVRHGRYAHSGAFARHSAEDREAVDWAMDVADAAGLASRRLDELSGGERQRAWLATVLAQRAGVLLLDEPTTYLDLKHQYEVLDLVRRLADEHGIACGLVLHDLGQAAGYADQVAVVAGGRVIAKGPSAEVITDETVARAFDLSVTILRDPGTGHVAVFPRPTTEQQLT
ncbi:ABC transporter ATP-binding protein [Phytomonospora sp. NPDC050363]|uniref:ABC transporter ATP-binding protein n=1 Tax=Phytomonospora sp. NPDC050363 TaxID=3155642 RepID=UPI0034092C34